MCLSRPMEKGEEKHFKYEIENGFCVGYKEFNQDGGNYIYPLYFDSENKRIPLKKWVHEKDWRNEDYGSIHAEAFPNNLYPCGWHIYLKPEGGSRKVYFRKVVRKGWQINWNFRSEPAVVAKEMYVIPVKEGGRVD